MRISIVFPLVACLVLSAAPGRAAEVPPAKAAEPPVKTAAFAYAYVKDLAEKLHPEKRLMRIFISDKAFDVQRLRGARAHFTPAVELGQLSGILLEFNPDELQGSAVVKEMTKPQPNRSLTVVSGLPISQYVKDLTINKKEVAGTLVYKSAETPAMNRNVRFVAPLLTEDAVKTTTVKPQLAATPQVQLRHRLGASAAKDDLAQIKSLTARANQPEVDYLIGQYSRAEYMKELKNGDRLTPYFDHLYVRGDLAHLTAYEADGSGSQQDFIFEDGAWRLW